MLINRQNLISKLNLLKPGLSSKDIIEAGMCFNFHGDIIVTQNDFISISVPVETNIFGAVKAEELYKLLDKVSGEEVELKRVQNELSLKAIRKGGKSRAGIVIQEDAISPLLPQAEWGELPNQFKEAIAFCQFSTSTDMTTPHLTCIHLKGNKAESSDNWRISQFVMDSDMPYDFKLVAEAANYLSRYEVSHVSLDDSWVHFANADTGLIFSVRLVIAKSIEVDQYFDVQSKATIKLPDLTTTLDLMRVMVEGHTDLDLKVMMTFSQDKLTCRGQKEIGWVEDIIDIEYDGPDISMLANPLFLADILSRTQEIIVSDNTCLFFGTNFRHIMMLIKQ